MDSGFLWLAIWSIGGCVVVVRGLVSRGKHGGCGIAGYLSCR